MFHHFYDQHVPYQQGAVSSSDLESVIAYLNLNYNLISADVWLEKFLLGSLNKNDVCLSFDDALASQILIAAPILAKNGLKGFFFIYSSPFVGVPDNLEIYRHFRTVYYKNVDLFYKDFFERVYGLDPLIKSKVELTFDSKIYLNEFQFYSKNDKLFRFLRDKILSKFDYEFVMNELMNKHNFNSEKLIEQLYMKQVDIKNLHDTGHIIGLHSYSHPTMIHSLPISQQKLEYEQNIEHLTKVIGTKPITMSHPCGNYGLDTLKILKQLGVKLGFRDNFGISSIRSDLEVPRKDISDLIRELS
jgi:peptidoglycan/xylan/chitin deacetylase (PgdA/CDA1 family)